MERLTARSPKNNMAYLINVKSDEQVVESPYPNTLKLIMQSFERLAEYEESELEPEGIKLLAKAFEKVCTDVADDSCPYLYGWYQCDKCKDCPGNKGELHQDTQRDIDCWKNYYLQEAKKEQRSEDNVNPAD